MEDTIRITMLGYTGSGKTCYMLGMYAVMREGVRGFTFTTRDEDPDVDMDLELSERWERLVNETGVGRWPKPNDNTTIPYEFDFNHGLATMIGFDWLDYRGQALKESPSEAEVRELKAHLNESSAVLLCVSGEHLAPGSTARLQSAVATARMLKLLKEARASRDQPPAVGIVITKFDLCRHLGEEAVIDTVLQLFNPLFEADTGWLVMICPVSLGNTLAQDLDHGAIEPRNVHLPVSFAVYSAFRRGQEEVGERISGTQQALRSLQGGWIKTIWNRSEINARTNDHAALVREQEAIEKKLRLLTDDLVRGARFYYEGERVELDA
jgi:hypothetical protein